MKEIWIISFLTDKFLYPCISFVYLSLLSLSILLFKIFNFRFHVFFDWPFLDMRFRNSRCSAQRFVRSVRKSCLYMQNIFCSFRSIILRLGYDLPGLLFAEIFSWLKILMVEKLIVKNLSTLDRL